MSRNIHSSASYSDSSEDGGDSDISYNENKGDMHMNIMGDEMLPLNTNDNNSSNNDSDTDDSGIDDSDDGDELSFIAGPSKSSLGGSSFASSYKSYNSQKTRKIRNFSKINSNNNHKDSDNNNSNFTDSASNSNNANNANTETSTNTNDNANSAASRFDHNTTNYVALLRSKKMQSKTNPDEKGLTKSTSFTKNDYTAPSKTTSNNENNASDSNSASYISNLRSKYKSTNRIKSTNAILYRNCHGKRSSLRNNSSNNSNNINSSISLNSQNEYTTNGSNTNNESSQLYHPTPTREELYGEGANLGSSCTNSRTERLNPSGTSFRTSRRNGTNRFMPPSMSPNFPQYSTGGGSSSAASSSFRSRNQYSLGSIGHGGNGGKDSLYPEGSSYGDTMAAAAEFVRKGGVKLQGNFRVGEHVLIYLPALPLLSSNQDNDGNDCALGLDSGHGTSNGPQNDTSDNNGPLRLPTVAPVNKFGYPYGEGKKEEHKKGPFKYVLAIVRQIHFKDVARHYTVERIDTGETVKSDADTVCMEPIEAGSDAERAAIDAANRKYRTVKTRSVRSVIFNRNNWMKSCCISCKETFQSQVQRFKHHSKQLITGSNPYRCEISITSVNVLVLCSLIVAFLDLMKHAFFAKGADHHLGIVLFVAWIVLVLELFLQVIIRPDDYHKLLRNEQACNPSTVRFINSFHLFFEGLALLLVVPDFLPIFGVNPFISSVEASIYSVVGKSISRYILGHLYFFTTRLRLFCLVRHKRTHWINTLYLGKKDAVRTKFDPMSSVKDLSYKPENLWTKRERVRRDKSITENDEDELLAKAAKIGSALLLVNSHRAMILLLIIALFVPFIASAANGGPDHTIFRMTNYLHEMNLRSYQENATDCQFFRSSVNGWVNAERIVSKSLDVSIDNEGPAVVWAQLLPTRCFPNGIITPYPEQCEDDNDNNDICNRWTDATIEDIVELLSIRENALIEATRSNENGVETTVVYDLSRTVSLSCFNAFLLQLLMLMLVLVSLAYLKSDANSFVIMPLRRMLKIVLKYASNPLVAHKPEKKINKKSLSKSSSNISQCSVKSTTSMNSIDDPGFDDVYSEKDQLGSFETEQLTAAVKKITDLLRKCWGVAGAGIISSNLKRTKKGDTVVFNPTVPGKLVYALFGFVGINDFSHLLRSLAGEVMTLINDIALVIHNEVYRWGLNESGQCNKNLGSTFLMVYRIGDFEEVRKKNNEAKNVIFLQDDLHGSITSNSSNRATTDHEKNAIHLAALPGINAFGDRALLGLLKSFAGINRAPSIKNWEKDYRVGGGVGAFSVGVSFGMDAGWAVEGAVGSGYKIDATYLSSHVNMASRMMSACKQYQLSILLSQAVEELLSKQCRSKLRHVDTVYVKGSKERQRIYTYDARNKFVDFFLNSRTDKRADEEAKNYNVQVWEKDQDLQEMRSHISSRFLSVYENGLSQYLFGNWKEAAAKLKEANECMIHDIVDSGRIEVVSTVKTKLLDSLTKDEDAVSARKEYGDGPCQTIISYIEKHDCIPPENWDGVRPLTSK